MPTEMEELQKELAEKKERLENETRRADANEIAFIDEIQKKEKQERTLTPEKLRLDKERQKEIGVRMYASEPKEEAKKIEILTEEQEGREFQRLQKELSDTNKNIRRETWRADTHLEAFRTLVKPAVDTKTIAADMRKKLERGRSTTVANLPHRQQDGPSQGRGGG